MNPAIPRDPTRLKRILEILDAALDHPADQRIEWLHAQPGLDEALRADVERMLSRQSDKALGERIERGALLTPAAPNGFSSQIGARIGDYVLEAAIGEGGMGTVWKARKNGDARVPVVALKMPSGALLAKGGAERLLREADILAALNHPNIARLIEVGEHATGGLRWPFLVLEFVNGRSLLAHCQERRLPLRDRLALFLRVLGAVAYAHRALVLHRDLKPANVLVTDEGEVKLLDFGIAKLLADSGRTEETALTRLAGRALTPDYASPEQVAGRPLTVASDQYSLAVMLFELITGERPYRLKRGSAAELEEAILSAQTRRPSTVVSDAFAGAMHLPLARARRALAGDLDAILMKALKKAPDERYASVDEFKNDLERYLANRPVLATPDSMGYRVRKFVSANRLVVGAAASIALALLIGSTVALWQAAKAREQAALARQEADRAAQRFTEVRALANSLLFEVHDSIQWLPGATEARTKIVQRAVEYLNKLAADPLRDAALTRELAAGYRRIAEIQNFALYANLGNAADSTKHHEKSLSLLRPLATAPSASADDREAYASGLLAHGVNLLEQGRVNEADAITREGLSIRAARLAAAPGNPDLQRDVANAESYLANVRFEAGALDEALTLNQSMMDRYVGILPSDPKSARYRWGVICGYSNTASILYAKNHGAIAISRLHQAVARARELLLDKPGHYSILNGLGEYHRLIGEIHHRDGQLAAAREALNASIAVESELATKDANDIEVARNLALTAAELGVVESRMGLASGAKRIERALRDLERLVATRPDHRRLHTAQLIAMVAMSQSQRALQQNNAACATMSRAAHFKKNLETRWPGLYSVSRIEVRPCT